MFDRFTNRARKVMGLARQEAQRFNHHYIGTEHFLLGLLLEENGVAATTLRNFHVTPDAVRNAIGVDPSKEAQFKSFGQLPFKPRAKKALEVSSDIAQGLNHNYIGTEHLILGVLGVEDSVAVSALAKLDLSPEIIGKAVLRRIGASLDAPTPETSEDPDYEALVETEAPAFFDRYQEFTKKTAVYPGHGQRTHEGATYCAFGLLGEAGEVAEKLKKRVRLGGFDALTPGSTVVKEKPGEAPVTQTYDQFRDDIKKELGDVLWYIARLADEFGLSFSDIAGTNVAKLSSRKERGVLRGEGDNR